MLRQSPMSKQLMIRSITREADLPPSMGARLATSFQGGNPIEIATESEGRIILLLKLMANVHSMESRVIRFFGFKTTAGMD